MMLDKFMVKYKAMPVQIRASFWFLICSFFQKGISTVTTPVFTRLLSTSEYGQYNVFNSWLGIVSVFCTLNLFNGVYMQGLVKFSEENKVFSSSLQGLTTVMVAAWTVIYLLFRNWWNGLFSLTTVQMLAMLVMTWTSAVFSFWAVEQRVLHKYKILVMITVLVSLAKPILGIILVTHTEDKVTARILGLVLVELIGYTALYFIQMFAGKKFFSKKFWIYALAFNVPLIPHYLSQTVLSSVDRIMIQNMTGPVDAGIYSLAYSISLIMTLFNTALMQTIGPWMYKKIKEDRISAIAPVAYGTLVLTAILNLVLIAFAPEAVVIFAPESYYDAMYIIPPVAISAYFMYMYDLLAKFAFYYEKTIFIMAASVTGAVLNIVLNYIFIGIYGYKAAGYTTLICYIAYSICHYIFMNKVCKEFCNGQKPYHLKKIMAITIPFVSVGFLLLFTYNSMPVRYCLIAAGCVLLLIKRRDSIKLVKSILDIRKLH